MTEPLFIPITLEPGAEPPDYATLGSAGADIKAYLQAPVIIEPGMTALIPTGLRVAIPAGYEMQVRPRSGLALKYGVTVLNTPGTVDSDYRGSVGVILINHSKVPFTVTSGMRIGQAVIAAFVTADFIVAEELEITARGVGGFGHTGTH